MFDNPEKIEHLKRRNDFFKHLLKQIDDGWSLEDEPSFCISNWDGEDEYVETEQYMKDYCTASGTHLFLPEFHFKYSKNGKEDELTISLIFHFNTSEYGVSPEYVQDQIHDSEMEWVTIGDHEFCTEAGMFPLGRCEEERFQLSCTDLGYYCDAVTRIKEFFMKELAGYEPTRD